MEEREERVRAAATAAAVAKERGGGGYKASKMPAWSSFLCLPAPLPACLPACSPVPFLLGVSLHLSLSLSHSHCGLIAAIQAHPPHAHPLTQAGTRRWVSSVPGNVANECRLQWEHWQKPTAHTHTHTHTPAPGRRPLHVSARKASWVKSFSPEYLVELNFFALKLPSLPSGSGRVVVPKL